jgi:hypothetical protein
VTTDEAIVRCRARWTHPPLDRRDVEERIALRLRDHESPPELRVVAIAPACRIFVESRDGWRSRYVHTIGEVDSVLDELDLFAAALERKVA